MAGRRNGTSSNATSSNATSSNATSSNAAGRRRDAGHPERRATVAPPTHQHGDIDEPPAIPDCRAATAARPRRLRGVRRHHDRVVRLLHLRHGRCARVRQGVLFEHDGSRCRDAARVRHVLGRFRRAAARRHRVRASRRPRRPQDRARDHAGDDGAGHDGHRSVARLCADRRLGAGRPRRAARAAGHRGRRRVGRRGADRERERAEASQHPVCGVRAAGRPPATCWPRPRSSR